MEIFDSCDSNFYPNINFFLQILVTLPIFTTTSTTTKVESFFSTLKRVIILLRNTIVQER